MSGQDRIHLSPRYGQTRWHWHMSFAGRRNQVKPAKTDAIEGCDPRTGPQGCQQVQAARAPARAANLAAREILALDEQHARTAKRKLPRGNGAGWPGPNDNHVPQL